ncbi:hypothetical protein SAMN05216554_0619 [Herbiconiux ginsengi]|uniref:Uncharacterized protein n=2 Tax=Herbiconiux ginsengi TaxID=381665 RepID=A0A1H3KNG6_9MICO|nr:hypothetical protein SAMN05216554_0619 [Herbiconiux ginsengi]
MAARTAGILGSIGALAVLSGCVPLTSTPTAAEAFPVLERPATDADTVVGEQNDPPLYEPDTARFLIEHEGDRVWIALTDEGAVCLLLGTNAVSASCGGPPIASPGQLQAGIELAYGGPEYRLLAAGEPAIPLDGFEQLTDNLWVSTDAR